MINVYEQSAQFIKVLAHPARLAILELLRDGEVCVCHLEAALHQRQAYVSQQLSILREAGLVEDRREGWRVYYHVTQPQVYDVLTAISRMTGVNFTAVAVPDTCPCPRCSPVMVSA
jgi:ArsR family transcriptional regulator